MRRRYRTLKRDNDRELARLTAAGTITPQEARLLIATCRAGIPYMPQRTRQQRGL